VEHQVDKRLEHGHSLDPVWCSWEGSFHACEGGVSGHGDTRAGGLLLLFLENYQETSKRDTANKHSLELCASIVLASRVVFASDSMSLFYS
jgi:hypothetical protein